MLPDAQNSFWKPSIITNISHHYQHQRQGQTIRPWPCLSRFNSRQVHRFSPPPPAREPVHLLNVDENDAKCINQMLLKRDTWSCRGRSQHGNYVPANSRRWWWRWLMPGLAFERVLFICCFFVWKCCAKSPEAIIVIIEDGSRSGMAESPFLFPTSNRIGEVNLSITDVALGENEERDALCCVPRRWWWWCSSATIA